eukprot:gene35059-57944_t
MQAPLEFRPKLLQALQGYSRQRFWGDVGAGLTVGVVAATIVSFVLIYLVVRLVLTAIIKRLISGKDPANRSADRFLGFGLAGAKAALMVWIGASAATFVENNLVL